MSTLIRLEVSWDRLLISSLVTNNSKSIKSDGSRVQMRNFSENRKLREKLRQKDIRNIRPTETSSSPIISTSALTTPDPFSTSTYLTSITSPVPERRPQSKYKSAEANYLALRREAVDMNQEENNYWFEMINGSLLFWLTPSRKNNNYKARQYTSTSTTPGTSKLETEKFDTSYLFYLKLLQNKIYWDTLRLKCF